MEMMEAKRNVLSAHPLFGLLPDHQLADLLRDPAAMVVRYRKGQIIHLQHEACTALEVMLAGSTSVQRINEDGHVLRIAAFAPGDILGANLLFASRNLYPYTVIAEADCAVLRFQRGLMLRLAQSGQPFLAQLLTVISDRTQMMADIIDTISHKSIRQRLRDVFILEYRTQGTNPIRLPISKKDLAERLGIQRTSLSRAMDSMRRDGLIAFENRVVRLTGLLEDANA